MALQQDNALQSKPEYVTFALFFIMFGLAVIAALLNLMLLKFMTMNTEDENRDEIEALEAARLTVKLDGDVIMGEIVDNRRYASQPGLTGSVEDLRSVCSCTCLSCAPGFLTRYRPPARPPAGQVGFSRDRSASQSPPPVLYSDYYQSPARSRPCSAHDLRSDSGLLTPAPTNYVHPLLQRQVLSSKFVWVKIYQFYFYQHHLY